MFIKKNCLPQIIFCALFVFSLLYFYDNAYADNVTNNVYSNTLYSDGLYNSYYYLQLDDGARRIYDELYSNIAKTQSGLEEIKIDLSEYMIEAKYAATYFQSALDAFDRDHPEVFWIDINKIEFKYSLIEIDKEEYLENVYITCSLEYSNYLIDSYEDSEQVSKDVDIMEKMIEEQIPYINAFRGENETYDKIKYIHDLLVISNDYNSDLSSASSKAYKSISAIIGNTQGEDAPVCEGYARAFKVLCDKAGIGCVIVSGYGIVANSRIEHMWNYVLIDDKWYAIDVTWDDPIISVGNYDDMPDEKKYAYFLRGSSDFLSSHYENNVFVQKDNYYFEFGYPIIEYKEYEITVPTFKIIFENLEGGSIVTNQKDINSVIPGTVVKLSLYPDENMEYVPGNLTFNGNKYFALSFVMPSKDVFISIKFTQVKEKEEENVKEDTKEKYPVFPSKSPQKDETPTNKPVNNNNNENEDKEDIVEEQEEIKESDKEDSKKEEIIEIESEDKISESINDFLHKDKVKYKINNLTTLNTLTSLIKVGMSKDSFGQDIVVSFFNSIYDENDIKQMIYASPYINRNYSHFDAFTFKVLLQSNGKLATLNEDGYISFILPLDEFNYKEKVGISFYRINNSVLEKCDYRIAKIQDVNYLYVKLYSTCDTFLIIYNDDDEKSVTLNSTTYSSSKEENNNDVKIEIESFNQKSDNSNVKVLAFVAIIIMVLILLMIIIISLYMYYLNKVV